MGTDIRLIAEDGHELGAYRADSAGRPYGGIVVCQEIFGINGHIRDVCDRFATDGFTVVAPALYDRSSRKDCQLGYESADVEIGRKLREEFSLDDTVRDVKAAAGLLQAEGCKVVTVGYCWGGTISFLAGTRLFVAGAVVYYGGQIIPYVEEAENCPLLMHFGSQDQSIPLSDVEKLQASHPKAVIHVYQAGHGFNCDRRSSYEKTAAELARSRTLEFFLDCVAD